MLLQLLTLLLPIRASESEILFHQELVLRAYRKYHGTLEAMGFRDRNLLRRIEKQTAFSMAVLKRYRPTVWRKFTQYHNRVWSRKKKIPNFPVID